MHFMGLGGQPRRMPDYADRFYTLNAISSFGSLITLVGLGVLIYLIWKAQKDKLTKA